MESRLGLLEAAWRLIGTLNGGCIGLVVADLG